MMRAASVRLAVLVTAIAALPHQMSSASPAARARAAAREQAATAARSFLSEYVARDGRVVRIDQGGDTVSEGQAYGMLLAVAVRDHTQFARVWSWTASNLQRSDGLLAWHWADARVTDSMPATDADLDATRALLLAADAFGEPSYRDEANRLSAAILANETVDVGGRPVLVAGPWARGAPGSEPAAVVNPSYLSPRTYAELAASTGDSRWGSLRQTAGEEIAALTQQSLPPDWATVDHSGGIQPSGPPGGGRVGYGADAARVPLRFAEDCDSTLRGLSAGLWPRLHYETHRSTVGYVAAAGAADAAGKARERDVLLDRAASSESRRSTYYGAAWVALARIMLTTDMLDSCSR